MDYTIIMSNITLRVTLSKLTFHNTNKKYSKTSVGFRSKDSYSTLPNPRFIKNNQAKFYSHNLCIDIQDQKEIVELEVYGINACSKEIIGKSAFELSNIRQSRELEWEFNSETFDLECKIDVFDAEKEETLSDDDLTQTEIFMNNFDIPNFAQRLQKKSTLVPNHQKSIQTRRSLSQLEHSNSNKTETLSEITQEKSFLSSLKSKGVTFKRNNSCDSSKLTDIPDYQFIEPITHSLLTSPASSVVRAGLLTISKFEGNQELGKSRCYICKIKLPVRNIIQYIGISFASFVIGTIVKQGLSF